MFHYKDNQKAGIRTFPVRKFMFRLSLLQTTYTTPVGGLRDAVKFANFKF